MQMTPEQLEYAISQYVDGVLPPLERAALERHLAQDPQARQLLGEYHSLQQMLRQAQPMPQVRWERLAEHLSSAVATQPAPVRHRRLYHRVAGGLAVAASLLVAFGITVRVYLATQEIPTADTVVVVVDAGPTLALADMLHQEVSIGPARGVSEAAWADADGVLTRPSRVIIASAREAGPEPDRMPH